MTTAAPVALLSHAIDPRWIGDNGVMMPWAHILLFDRASDELFDMIGMDAEFRELNHHSAFALEARLRMQRAPGDGEQVRIVGQIIDHSDRFVHVLFVMYAKDEDERLAENEILYLFVDTESRRPCPMHESIATHVRALGAAHKTLGRPEGLDHPIRLSPP